MTRVALLLFILGALGAVASCPARADAETALQSKRPQSSILTAAERFEVRDPDEVYRVNLRRRAPSMLVVHLDIDSCCYLYRDKTKITLVSANGKPAPASTRLGDYVLPPGKIKTDEFIGKTEVYYGNVDIDVPIEGSTANLALNVSYQGCAEKPVKICYPPAGKLLPLAGAATGGEHMPDAGLWLALAAAFGAGLLLSFTPCVLPMIPILSGVIIETSGAGLSRLRGAALSYCYVLGTAVTYAAAGAIAGITGEQLQAHFQNAWAIGLFAALLVLLALSMFGLYELQMPAALQSALHGRSSTLRHRARRWLAGEFIGVFLLGLVSALVIGACVSPVLVSVLGGAIAARDPWLGAGVMFALAHGQGMILLALGIGEGVLLPKAGAWMNAIKHVFGALLVAVAIYLLGFLPQVPVLLLWSAWFIVCAVYLGATQRLPGGASGWRYLWKGLGTVSLIWGALALIGGFAGGRDVFNPLPLPLLKGATSRPAESLFERITSVAQLERRLAEAKAARRPVALDYYADWCTDCVRMAKATFIDTDVRAELTNRFVSLQIDVTNSNDPETRALKNRFEVYGPPASLFFSSAGKEIKELRSYGFLDRQAFLAVLRRVN